MYLGSKESNQRIIQKIKDKICAIAQKHLLPADDKDDVDA